MAWHSGHGLLCPPLPASLLQAAGVTGLWCVSQGLCASLSLRVCRCASSFTPAVMLACVFWSSFCVTRSTLSTPAESSLGSGTQYFVVWLVLS